MDGTIDIICTPLIRQIHNDLYHIYETQGIQRLMTVLVSLQNGQQLLDTLEEEYNGFHTIEKEADLVQFHDIIIFCCRGVARSCNCNQTRGRKGTL